MSFDIYNNIREKLLNVCDNIHPSLILPEQLLQDSAEFPVIAFVLTDTEVNRRMLQQSFSIVGFVKEEENDLLESIINFRNEIFNAIYNTNPKVNIEVINMSNVYQPFGIEGFLAPPFAGVRFDCIVPDSIDSE